MRNRLFLLIISAICVAGCGRAPELIPAVPGLISSEIEVGTLREDASKLRCQHAFPHGAHRAASVAASLEPPSNATFAGTSKFVPPIEPVATPAPPAPAGPSPVLILYDGKNGSPDGRYGRLYAMLIENLLGHFRLRAETAPVESYAAGAIDAHDATFYVGSIAGNPLPPSFLADVLATRKRVIWLKHNLEQIAAPALRNGFIEKFGFEHRAIRSLNAPPTPSDPEPGFFDTVLYKNRALTKHYSYDRATGIAHADPDIGEVRVTDVRRATVHASIRNPKTRETVPYIVRSAQFHYVADIPFTYIGPRDRYLVFCDALHDLIGIDHPQSHRALVRLEDVGALVEPRSMKRIADALAATKVPFSVAAIPHYRDPKGAYNGGVPQEIPLAAADVLQSALRYAIAKGGSIVTHGYTHQYEDEINDQSGVSGDDFEFWDAIRNAPVRLDSREWVLGRLDRATAELRAAGFSPFAWEAPHYQASPAGYHAFVERFATTYHRVAYYSSENPTRLGAPGPDRDLMAGLYYPYVIHRDTYGQRVIPENLGSISYDIRHIDPFNPNSIPWQTLVGNAEANLVVRDGFASFFFHPFWLEPELGLTGALGDLKSLVRGIQKLGYRFVAAGQIRD